MKRLFCVKNKRTGNKLYNLTTYDESVSKDTYTDSKSYAKLIRDDLGGVNEGFYVAKGPDHWRFTL